MYHKYDTLSEANRYLSKYKTHLAYYKESRVDETENYMKHRAVDVSYLQRNPKGEHFEEENGDQ